jgi:hypothetical protein
MFNTAGIFYVLYSRHFYVFIQHAFFTFFIQQAIFMFLYSIHFLCFLYSRLFLCFYTADEKIESSGEIGSKHYQNCPPLISPLTKF